MTDAAAAATMISVGLVCMTALCAWICYLHARR